MCANSKVNSGMIAINRPARPLSRFSARSISDALQPSSSIIR